MNKVNIKLTPPLSFFIGIFLLSSAVLSFEILITRISSVIYIHNYAFMAVSLAILGLGCGGIFVFYRWRNKKSVQYYREFAFFSSFFAISISLFIVLITMLPFAINKFFYFLVISIPFFFAGVALSLAFSFFSHESFKLYAADLLGAASGAVLSIGILNTLGGINGILFVATIGAVASVVFMTGHRARFASLKIPLILSILCALLFFASINFPFLKEVPIAKHHGKDLYNMVSDPLLKAEIIESRWSAFGRTDLAKYKDDDRIMSLFIDGAAGTSMFKFNGDLKNPGEDIELLKMSFSGYFPFWFLKENEKDDMLIIGPGAGREVLLGLIADVKNITGIEINKDFVDIVKDYRDYNGGIYTDFENVNIIADEGRSFLRGSDKRYDIIMITLPLTKSSRSLEGYALTENYLLTVESIRDYLNHLTQEGRMIVVLHDWHEILRFITTALTTLEELGIKNQDAMKHIYTVGSGMNPLLVLKKMAFTAEKANLRHEGMHFLKFDYPSATYIPHIEQQTILHEHRKGIFHKLGMFNSAIVALSLGNIKLNDLVKAMPHDINPVYDDKPFFFKHSPGVPSDISVLLGAVVLANIFAIMLFFVYKKLDSTMVKLLAVFTLLGAGFMLIEISFFQKLTLYLGSPTISLAVLLGSLLAGMGAGSFFGRRFYPDDNILRLKMFSFIISAVVVALFFIQPMVLNNFLGAGILVKGFTCSAFLVPLGFILGVPFPTAINSMEKIGAGDVIAWMYGINGTMSVLGSVTAVAISLLFGFSTALIIGALCYLAIAFILT